MIQITGKPSPPGSDLGLYVRGSEEPTLKVSSCQAPTNSNHATCLISDPAPGTWYASVLTRGGRIGVGYKISAKSAG